MRGSRIQLCRQSPEETRLPGSGDGQNRAVGHPAGGFLLQTHFNKLAAADYSEWVVKRAKTSSIFIEAVDLGFLAANPMAKVRLPRCKATEKPVVPREDVMRLYAAIPALRDRLMFRIRVFLGARASELFGLAADCWNGSDALEVRQTAWKGKLHKQVKTRNSRRVVPVPPEMKEKIDSHAAFQTLTDGKIGRASRLN